MKFIFCGDFVSQDPKSIQVDLRLQNLFKDADYVAVNFEAPVRGVGKPICKSGPSLTQSEDSPAFIENLGVNIIMLANNHMMDQDQEGCEASIKAFKGETRIIGAGCFDDAYRLHVIEKDGVNVGLLCLVHKEFGALGLDATSLDYGTALCFLMQVWKIWSFLFQSGELATGSLSTWEPMQLSHLIHILHKDGKSTRGK